MSVIDEMRGAVLLFILMFLVCLQRGPLGTAGKPIKPSSLRLFGAANQSSIRDCRLGEMMREQPKTLRESAVATRALGITG